MKFELYRAIGASELPSMPKLLALILLGYADINGKNAYPSLSTLAKQCGWKDKSTAKRHLRTLVDSGCVRVMPRKDQTGNLNLTNVYEFVADWVGATETPLPTSEPVVSAQQPPLRGPASTDGEVSPAPQSFPIPIPIPIKSAPPSRVMDLPSHKLVKSIVPDGHPLRTYAELARTVENQMADGVPSEFIAEGLRIWLTKPDAGTRLLPNLISDAAKGRTSQKARQSTADQRSQAALDLRRPEWDDYDPASSPPRIGLAAKLSRKAIA